MKLRKILALGIVVLMITAMFMVPTAMASNDPFNALSLPASAWASYRHDSDWADDWQFSGGSGNAVNITAGSDNGWGRAQLMFTEPMEGIYEISVTFTSSGNVHILAATSEGYGPRLNAGDAYIPAGTHTLTFDLDEAITMYGFWFQVIGGGVTITVNSLLISTEVGGTANQTTQTTLSPGATPTPTPAATATPTATASPTATPGDENPKTFDAGVAMLVLTGLAGMGGAAVALKKKKS